MRTRHRTSLALGWALLGTVSAASLSACLEPRRLPATKRNECTSCHGDASRSGDLTKKAAPPVDLQGSTAASASGVGAHQIHLNAGATHAAVDCDECHVVPSDVFAPGHIDTQPPAEVTFGALATEGGLSPAYDFRTRTCSNTYCHQAASPVWNVPRTSDQACGSCHGLPPPAPHPQNQQCSVCHGAVVDAERNFVKPARHVDGVVDLNPQACSGCHGDANRSGDAVAQAAPPLDLAGNSDPSAPGVGAHQLHLQASPTHGAVGCAECHLVPTSYLSAGHADHPPPATLTFGPLATQGSRAPVYDFGTRNCSGTYCHGTGTPVWIRPRSSDQTCGSCHGLPPGLPHPQVADCSRCHGAVIDANRAFVAPSLHVDGTFEVAPLTCSSCHGSASSPAPPTDLSGNSDRSSPGVGAHQVHLSGGVVSRPLACGECHVVPASIGSEHPAAGWDPARVALSGVASLSGTAPGYDRGTQTCGRTWCHGPSVPAASVSPAWTSIGPLRCNGCHGTPPPPSHPARTDCFSCHPDVDTLMQITNRSQHVNGLVNLNF